MAEPTLLDRTYSVLLRGFLETGQAPHYTEIAAELGVSPGEGREVQRKLFSIRGFPGWLYPKGDTVVKGPTTLAAPAEAPLTAPTDFRGHATLGCRQTSATVVVAEDFKSRRATKAQHR